MYIIIIYLRAQKCEFQMAANGTSRPLAGFSSLAAMGRSRMRADSREVPDPAIERTTLFTINIEESGHSERTPLSVPS